MKAISIRQPWASLIVLGYKEIENRTWPTSFRGSVLIHAAKKDDDAGYVEMLRRGIKFDRRPRTGGLIGKAEIVDCISSSRSTWFCGPYGFVIRNARPIPFVPFRGMLGFFDVPDDLPGLELENHHG